MEDDPDVSQGVTLDPHAAARLAAHSFMCVTPLYEHPAPAQQQDRDTLIADLASCRTFEELMGVDDDNADEPPLKPFPWDELIMRARALSGW